MAVQPFKCGPDYIDPAFHTAASGRPSYNLDSWGMRKTTVAHLLDTGTAHCELVIAEALMGLFDGVATAGTWGTGASADLAALTGWPVVLVLDVSGQSQTAAAVARGFVGYRDGVNIAGVILNRVGSDRHKRLATLGIEACGLKVLGAIPRKAEIAMPERHLGLVQAGETANLSATLDALADLIEAHVDVDAVVTAALAGRSVPATGQRLQPPGQRIALALDQAFSFVYPHVLQQWRMSGAEILPFSPLANEAPDPSCDVAWLPGGYPELHASTLAANATFKAGMTAFAAVNPVHGECGGYMVLGSGLIDAKGERHAMLGLLGLETSFAKRKMQLGYRRATLLTDSPIGAQGAAVAGHEFHYATILAVNDPPLAAVTNADGEPVSESGSKRGHVTGSFFHLVDQVTG
jgi:cobyrinic acid a,c-diamide synthase